MLQPPSCPHGPATVFSNVVPRPDAGFETRYYYACSAFRDRKLCPLVRDLNEEEVKIFLRDNRQHTHPELTKNLQEVSDVFLYLYNIATVCDRDQISEAEVVKFWDTIQQFSASADSR